MQVSREQMSHKERKGCLFRSFLTQITRLEDVIKECFRKIDNEELLGILSINMVIGTRLG